MQAYYDYTTLENLNVNQTTEAFIVENHDGTYFLRLVPAGVLQNLSCDMLSRQETYWPVSLPMTSRNTIAKLFPKGQLRGTPLSHDEVVDFFELDPTSVSPSRFNNQVVEQDSFELRAAPPSIAELNTIAQLNEGIYFYYRNGLNRFFTPFNSRDSFGSVSKAYFKYGFNKYFFTELTVGIITDFSFFLKYWVQPMLALSAIFFTGLATLSTIYAAKSVIEFTLSKSDQAAESLEFSGQLIKASLAVSAFIFLDSIFQSLILLTRAAATLVNGRSEEHVDLVNASL